MCVILHYAEYFWINLNYAFLEIFQSFKFRYAAVAPVYSGFVFYTN